MARLRTIKPRFFTNDLLAEVPPLGRLLFQALWCLADREGRLEDRPRRIKAEALPYDDCDVDDLLNELDARGFIQRYQAGAAAYIQVVNFVKHQTPHIKEAASTIPPPPGDGQAPDEHQTSTVQASGKPQPQPMLAPPVIGNLDPVIGEWGVEEHESAPDGATLAQDTTPPVAVAAGDESPQMVPRPKYSRRFEVFWKRWRELTNGEGEKAPAYRQWVKRRLDKAPSGELQAVMDGLEVWGRSERWARGYIVSPAKWLAEERWGDDPPAMALNGHARASPEKPGKAALIRDVLYGGDDGRSDLSGCDGAVVRDLSRAGDEPGGHAAGIRHLPPGA